MAKVRAGVVGAGAGGSSSSSSGAGGAGGAGSGVGALVEKPDFEVWYYDIDWESNDYRRKNEDEIKEEQER